MDRSSDLAPINTVAHHQPSPILRSSRRGWLIFLLFLGIFSGLGWLWYIGQQSRHEMLVRHAVLASQLEAQTKSLKETDQHLVILSQQLQQLQMTQTQLSDQIHMASQTPQETGQHWKIQEVAYLIRMANVQLTVYYGVDNALSLLKQASAVLDTMKAPTLTNLHQFITKDIAALQAIGHVDTASVVNQLSDLRDQVPDLSILVAPKPNTLVIPATINQAHKKWWQRAWDNIKASLQQLVIVRHGTESIPALMSPDEQHYLQENLQLLLLRAEWALLNHQGDLYQHSLATVRVWLEKYYVQNAATTQSFLKQLQALQAMVIAPALPDLTPTLALVEREAA